MKLKLNLLLAVIIIANITSCTKGVFVRGSERLTTETRTLQDFSKLANEGSFIIQIIQDTVSFVIIEAEDNLISLIRTNVQDDVLIIYTDENLNNRLPMKLEVHTSALSAMELNGSGEINFGHFFNNKFSAVNNGSGSILGGTNCKDAYLRSNGSGSMSLKIQTETIDVGIYGSGDIYLEGEADHGEMGIYGSGNIKYFNFLQKSCMTNTNGSGNIYVNVSELLDVKIYGSGSVYYQGNPSTIVKIDGSGELIKQ